MNLPPTYADQSHVVLLCTGKQSSGAPYWAYLRLSLLRAKAFDAARRSGAFQLDKFGEILRWGDGAEVPAAIQAEMEAEHGVVHGFEEGLRTALAAAKRNKK